MQARDKLLEEYRFLESEILRNMVGVEAEYYRPDAIAVATEVLRERGIEVSPAPPEPVASKRERADDLQTMGDMMLLGSAMCTVLGVAFTIVSRGGHIFYGAVVLAIGLFARGMVMRRDAERLRTEVSLAEGPVVETNAGTGADADQPPEAESPKAAVVEYKAPDLTSPWRD